MCFHRTFVNARRTESACVYFPEKLEGYKPEVSNFIELGYNGLHLSSKELETLTFLLAEL